MISGAMPLFSILFYYKYTINCVLIFKTVVEYTHEKI
jgi:hypothetical protein